MSCSFSIHLLKFFLIVSLSEQDGSSWFHYLFSPSNFRYAVYMASWTEHFLQSFSPSHFIFSITRHRILSINWHLNIHIHRHHLLEWHLCIFQEMMDKMCSASHWQTIMIVLFMNLSCLNDLFELEYLNFSRYQEEPFFEFAKISYCDMFWRGIKRLGIQYKVWYSIDLSALDAKELESPLKI